MTAIALALAASMTWGAADFAGGLLARRIHVVTLAAVSQAGGLGLAAFYRALATGTISVVAPIAACGAVVPLVLALAGGDDPRALALLGAVVALGGAVMASLEERK